MPRFQLIAFWESLCAKVIFHACEYILSLTKILLKKWEQSVKFFKTKSQRLQFKFVFCSNVSIMCRQKNGSYELDPFLMLK